MCNQSMLAPTVVRMKERIGTHWPYKDQRGEWKIIINKENDSLISVTHIKKEVSWESNSLFESQHFQFTWSLRRDFEFVDTVSDETKAKIIGSFNSTTFLEPFELH